MVILPLFSRLFFDIVSKKAKRWMPPPPPCSPLLCAYQGVTSVRSFGKFGVLCFLVTSMRFAFLSYYWRYVFSFSDTDDLKNNKEREAIMFISPCHFHAFGDIDASTHIFLQLCFWDFYLMFLITVHVITRLSLNETYQLPGFSI